MSAAEVLHGAYEAPRAYASGQGPQPDLRPTLLVTTVDIGEGRAGRIEVRQGDDPIDVAAAFCSRHGLPEAIVLPLAQHLEDNLAESGAWPEAGQPPAGAEYRQGEGAGDGEVGWNPAPGQHLHWLGGWRRIWCGPTRGGAKQVVCLARRPTGGLVSVPVGAPAGKPASHASLFSATADCYCAGVRGR